MSGSVAMTYFMIGWAVSVGFTFMSNLIMWAIYYMELKFFENYKISPEPWPWYSSPSEWRTLVRKSLLLVTFNNMVVLPFALMMNLLANNWTVSLSFRVEDLPGANTLMLTIFFCMICEDFAFYFVHKMLHSKLLYPYIHKVHH